MTGIAIAARRRVHLLEKPGFETFQSFTHCAAITV
jgi:hypothetical protein